MSFYYSLRPLVLSVVVAFAGCGGPSEPENRETNSDSEPKAVDDQPKVEAKLDEFPKSGKGDAQLTFDMVYKDPDTYKGKRVTWRGRASSFEGNKVLYIGTVGSDFRPVGKTASDYKSFLVEYETEDDVSYDDGTVSGTIMGSAESFQRITSPSGLTTTKAVSVPLLRFPEFVSSKTSAD